MKLPPILKTGERVRLTPGGPEVKVLRVSPCAAYVGVKTTKPHPDPQRAALGETITSEHSMAISLHSLVERVD